MKTRFIFNPHSGRNRRRPWLGGAIREFIAKRSLDADLAITEGPGHATELARSAAQAGCAVVVAVGGDGTMNEVAQALVHTPAALALVPCGSGNGLALHLGVPRSPFGALELASGADGKVARIDTGTVNGRPFFNAMGLGLDADVSHRFNRLTRRGLPAYVRTGFTALRELRSQRYHITGGGRRQECDALLVAIANSDQYGNDARIAPGARIDDGALDLVVVKPVSFVGAALLVARLFLGSLHASPNVIRLRGPRFGVRRSAAALIHTDGETHLAGVTLEVAVRPASLRVLVPARSSAVAAADAPRAARFALQLP